MATARSVIQLKHDQIFGAYACLEAAEVDPICARLQEARLEFTREPERAERLAEPGRRTVRFFDASPEELTEALAAGGWRVEVLQGFSPTPPYGPPLDRLIRLGEIVRGGRTSDSQAGFSAEHVPELIRMATDTELHQAPQDQPAVWAPLHAIRALGELKAEAAIEPLVRALRLIDDGDDWIGGELAAALGKIGPASLPALCGYLADETKGIWSRLGAGRAIVAVATAEPAARASCVSAIATQLTAAVAQGPALNGGLVSLLLDLRAVEVAAVIENAFATDRVDEMVAGDWEDVQVELGLKTRRGRARRPNEFTEMGRQLRDALGMPEPLQDGFGNPLPAAPPRSAVRIGRNEPCPCGSGKKYKKCCGT